MSRELVLLSINHPYTHTGGETMFVAPELAHLAREFSSVRVVPLHVSGDRLALPHGVVLDEALALQWQRWKGWHLLRAAIWPGVWPELWRGMRHGGPVGAVRVWRWAAIASATWAWMRAAWGAETGTPRLLYTYWRGGQTLAAGRWARQHPGTSVVSRVHRYELYEEAFQPPFQPWQSVYGELAQVITVARHGADYLRARGVGRLVVSRLGVASAPRRTAASDDGVFRVVSCSSVSRVKRVDVNAQALCALATAHPQRRIVWTHFGDGPEMPALRAALAAAPANLHTTLVGQVANAQVLRHYHTQPVDLFLLLSSSEGLPVSIQEAMAHGIPVLASDVGGVGEAVDASGDNGALVAVDAPLPVLADALEALWMAPASVAAARREAAWQHWARDFDAERNHSELATRLAALQPDPSWT